ncbi:MAG TPA: hypothetical protein PKE55_06355, partial [Kiritimatiellia bacterium]|nr:hypothetical protein [Kiritimatiellia bacterium]
MRGHPLLQWLLFAAVWSCLAYPIYRIAGAVPEVERAEREETERTTVWMTVSFSSTPRNFAVVQEGREVWAVAEPSGYSMERRGGVGEGGGGGGFRVLGGRAGGGWVGGVVGVGDDDGESGGYRVAGGGDVAGGGIGAGRGHTDDE